MTKMRFTDTATISGTHIRPQDGALVADAYAVRTGIQLYRGGEVGLVDRDVVRVWRPEDEVRSADSMITFSHAPITLDHPKEAVTAENWADLAKGEVSTEASWDGNRIKLPLIIKAKDAIEAVQSGIRDLSAGYTCTLDFADGVTPEGEAYDAIQRNIRINHLAIVPKGRAGNTRIGDSAENWGSAPITRADDKEVKMTTDALQTVVLGDKAVQVAAKDTAIIDAFKADQAQKLSDAEADHKKVVDAKDEEIGTLKADLKKAEDAAITPEKMSALVADRVALETTIKAIDKDIKIEGISDADLRKAAVAKALGDDMVADASEAEITGMFKAVAKDAGKGKDVLRDAAPGAKNVTGMADADKAQADYETRVRDAWKQPNTKGAVQ